MRLAGKIFYQEQRFEWIPQDAKTKLQVAHQCGVNELEWQLGQGADQKFSCRSLSMKQT